MKILPCILYDVVVNFNDVIRIQHLDLNIESTKYVAIQTFEWSNIWMDITCNKK